MPDPNEGGTQGKTTTTTTTVRTRGVATRSTRSSSKLKNSSKSDEASKKKKNDNSVTAQPPKKQTDDDDVVVVGVNTTNKDNEKKLPPTTATKAPTAAPLNNDKQQTADDDDDDDDDDDNSSKTTTTTSTAGGGNATTKNQVEGGVKDVKTVAVAALKELFHQPPPPLLREESKPKATAQRASGATSATATTATQGDGPPPAKKARTTKKKTNNNNNNTPAHQDQSQTPAANAGQPETAMLTEEEAVKNVTKPTDTAGDKKPSGDLDWPDIHWRVDVPEDIRTFVRLARAQYRKDRRKMTQMQKTMTDLRQSNRDLGREVKLLKDTLSKARHELAKVKVREELTKIATATTTTATPKSKTKASAAATAKNVPAPKQPVVAAVAAATAAQLKQSVAASTTVATKPRPETFFVMPDPKVLAQQFKDTPPPSPRRTLPAPKPPSVTTKPPEVKAAPPPLPPPPPPAAAAVTQPILVPQPAPVPEPEPETVPEKKPPPHAVKSFEERLAELKHYADGNGHCRPPTRGGSLGRWVMEIRRTYKKCQEDPLFLTAGVGPTFLNPQRIKQLEEIGFEWVVAPPQVGFDQRLKQLIEFKEKFGHLRPPRHGEYASLGEFVKLQRRLYQTNTMPKDRMEKLNEIGFVWSTEVLKVTFDQRLEQCREFRRKHGHLSVPTPLAGAAAEKEPGYTKEEHGFRIWAARKRVCYYEYQAGRQTKIDKNQIRKMDALGFDWQRPEGGMRETKGDREARQRQPKTAFVPWDTRFNELVKFKAKHGTLEVPRSEEYKALADWVKLQRRNYRDKFKHLADERIKQLEAIGFVFEPGARKVGFDERVEQCRQFKARNGHLSVPPPEEEGDDEDDEAELDAEEGFRVWAHNRRQDYHRLQAGRSARIKPEHIDRLNELGFDWGSPEGQEQPNRKRKSPPAADAVAHAPPQVPAAAAAPPPTQMAHSFESDPLEYATQQHHQQHHNYHHHHDVHDVDDPLAIFDPQRDRDLLLARLRWPFAGRI